MGSVGSAECPWGGRTVRRVGGTARSLRSGLPRRGHGAGFQPGYCLPYLLASVRAEWLLRVSAVAHRCVRACRWMSEGCSVGGRLRAAWFGCLGVWMCVCACVPQSSVACGVSILGPAVLWAGVWLCVPGCWLFVLWRKTAAVSSAASKSSTGVAASRS